MAARSFGATMTKLQSFFAHVAAAIAVVGPYLALVATFPGSVGHYAGLAVQALVGVGLLRITLPNSAPPAKGAQAGFVRTGTLVALAVLAVACAALQKIEADPHAAARKGIQDAAKLCDADKRLVAAGDIPDEPYIDAACSLLLMPVAMPAPSAAHAGAGGV